MSDDALRSPLAFFESVLGPYAPLDPGVRNYAAQWAADDGSDPQQQRDRGYAAGIIQRVHKQESLLPSAAMLYITAFYDPTLSSFYIESLVIRHMVDKYAPDDVQPALLSHMQDTHSPWRGVSWYEHSDQVMRVSAGVDDAGWYLDGIITLDPGTLVGDLNLIYSDGLLLLPRYRDDGSDNFRVTQPDYVRVKLQDSHAWLIGTREDADTLLLEMGMIRAALGAVARLGRRQQEQPPDDVNLRAALALAWAAMQAGDDTAREVAGLYSDTYQRFRLLARLARNYGFPRPIVPVEDGLTDDSETAQALLADLSEFLSPELNAEPLAERVAQAYLRKFESAISLLQ
jgi:hypothetical protein